MNESYSMWSKQHLNAIAYDIRNQFPTEHEYTAERHAITMLALKLARRFAKRNPSFDPVKWLNQCSPDVDLFPLGELW